MNELPANLDTNKTKRNFKRIDFVVLLLFVVMGVGLVLLYKPGVVLTLDSLLTPKLGESANIADKESPFKVEEPVIPTVTPNTLLIPYDYFVSYTVNSDTGEREISAISTRVVDKNAGEISLEVKNADSLTIKSEVVSRVVQYLDAVGKNTKEISFAELKRDDRVIAYFSKSTPVFVEIIVKK